MARILLIDDDRDILLSLRMVLEAHGHEVHELTHVREVAAEVARVAPDLVILDVMFPSDLEAGFKAARALRRDPATADIPIVILSAVNQRSPMGFTFSDDDISPDFLPVEAFVEKPVEPSKLLALVDRCLGKA